MMKLTVNGRTVDAGDGSTLLDAIKAAGVHLPTLCHHPRLPSHAVCRLCLVNVKGQARPQPACVTKARDGDIVETDAKELLDFRDTDLAWLLARHPNDCLERVHAARHQLGFQGHLLHHTGTHPRH